MHACRSTLEDPTEFAQYLFLLELSHNWGPELQVPGAVPGRLIGFDFHWSFFLDAGGSPIGGNVWHDDGGGAFTAQPFDAAAVRYSPLDLYLLGLGSPDDVAPFGLLTSVTVPATALDPFTGRTCSKESFPWQGPGPLTVTATRETFTMADVVAQNGPRAPAFGASPTTLQLGIVLLVGSETTRDEEDAFARAFAPIAEGLAPAFHRATGERGTLTVVTSSQAPPPVPAAGEGEGEGEGDGPAPPPKSGCAATSTSTSHGAPAAAALLALGLLAVGGRRRRG